MLNGLVFCRAYKHLQLCGLLLAGLHELSVHFHCILLLFSVLMLSFVAIFRDFTKVHTVSLSQEKKMYS